MHSFALLGTANYHVSQNLQLQQWGHGASTQAYDSARRVNFLIPVYQMIGCPSPLCPTQLIGYTLGFVFHTIRSHAQSKRRRFSVPPTDSPTPQPPKTRHLTSTMLTQLFQRPHGRRMYPVLQQLPVIELPPTSMFSGFKVPFFNVKLL